MVVSHDHRGRVPLQRELHDLSRVHACAVYGATEQLLELNQAMPLVEV
jgi:hypothetical protein